MDLISVDRLDGLAFEIRVRDRRVVSDMAPSDGGRGEGFTPLELIAGAAGACIAMAVQAWCESCNHDGGDVAASVTFEIAADPKRMGTIVVDLEVPAEVPANRRDALRRVIEECPIRETLRNPPPVDVEILMNSEG
jgi:uncharacterized OsmC-like protein